MATIQKRFSYEEARAYYATIKNGIEEVCGACYEFAKVAEQMHGKVLNKRFIDAVNDALLTRFGYSDLREHKCKRVQMFSSNDYTRAYSFRVSLLKRSYDQPTDRDYTLPIYFDKELVMEVRVGEQSLIDGKRINAEAFATAARFTADYNLRVYERYREALVRWEEELQAVEELNAYINRVNKELAERVSHINQLFIPDDMRDLSGYSVWRHAKYSSDWYKKKRGQINK